VERDQNLQNDAVFVLHYYSAQSLKQRYRLFHAYLLAGLQYSAPLNTLRNAVLQGCPSFLSKEVPQELFCFLGGDNFTQITSLVNRGSRDQSVIRSEFANSRDYIGEAHRSSEPEESAGYCIWVEQGCCVQTRNVDDIAEVFCFCTLAMITNVTAVSTYVEEIPRMERHFP
jgi:hypothetical protein